MTKSRLSSSRVLLGVLGKSSSSSLMLREWNRFLRDAGIDGSMDRYPCTVATLPERLSAMLHFDRRGYIVTESLQKSVAALMDRLDPSAKKRKAVDTIVNDGGILIGYWTDGNDALRQEFLLHSPHGKKRVIVSAPQRCTSPRKARPSTCGV